MTRRQAASAVICALALVTSPSWAAVPQFWRIEGAPAFLEGDLEGLSLDSQGRLRLGAAPRQIYDPVAPNGWVIARDKSGTLYVGTGNDGRVMRLQGSQGTLLFDAEELEVHALAVGPDGRVYAGTSPDGAVYVLPAAGGKPVRFFDPPEKYIWALAFDGKGRLHVATGAEARIYRVDDRGQAATILTSADTHILSLALDRRGRLFAGSAPEGIVYRVGTDGDVFVAYDAPFREIRALDVGDDGSVYAAAVDAQTAPEKLPAAVAPAAAATPPGTPVPEVTITESYSIAPSAGGPAIVASASPETGAAVPPKGALLRIGESGEVDTLWTSGEDVPHTLLRLADAVLVGTGNKGKLYRVTADREWTLVATLAAEQVTALARDGDRGAAVLTSNPARVYALDGAVAGRGTFVSQIKDAGAASRWGVVTWEGTAPSGSEVQIQTRAGNTEHPDATWSNWSAASSRSRSEPIRSERARFLQIRLTLSRKDGASPTVEAVAASFLQRNLPPDVKAVTVHPAGEVFQKPISVSGEAEILGLEPSPPAERSSAATVTPAAVTFSRKMFQRGLRTVSWQAEDPNGDALLYEAQYRAVGDERWRSLRRGLTEPVLAWDTSTVPNGRYLVRVVASDAPANPPLLALSATKDSTSFEVDNTAPRIEARLERGRSLAIRAIVHDDSPIQRLEIAVDAGRWEQVHPLDGIADSQEETYEIPLAADPSGPRTTMLRASDILGNMATVRVDVP